MRCIYQQLQYEYQLFQQQQFDVSIQHSLMQQHLIHITNALIITYPLTQTAISQYIDVDRGRLGDILKSNSCDNNELNELGMMTELLYMERLDQLEFRYITLQLCYFQQWDTPLLRNAIIKYAMDAMYEDQSNVSELRAATGLDQNNLKNVFLCGTMTNGSDPTLKFIMKLLWWLEQRRRGWLQQ